MITDPYYDGYVSIYAQYSGINPYKSVVARKQFMAGRWAAYYEIFPQKAN